MNTSRLTRLAGSMASLGGSLWLLLRDRSVVNFDGYPVGVLQLAVPLVLLLIGLIGLHLQQSTRANWAGWTVGVGVCNGIALMVASRIGEAATLPTGPGSTWSFQVFALASAVLALGSVVYGIVALRSPLPTRVAAAVMVIGSPSPLFPLFGHGGDVAIVLSLLFGMGWLALGLLLLRGSSASRPHRCMIRPRYCPAT